MPCSQSSLHPVLSLPTKCNGKATDGRFVVVRKTNVLSAPIRYVRCFLEVSFSHPTQVVHLGQTKESGIGVRVPAAFNPGKRLWGSNSQCTRRYWAKQLALDKEAPWLNIEGRALGNAAAGLVFLTCVTEEVGPGLHDDYGCHVYNPARHAAIHLEPGHR